MQGYYRRPDATAETIDENGWLQTGDLGYLTGDGKLCLAGGRIKDMIIRGGENIYPAEIENLLLGYAGVAQVAVFAFPDPYYGEVAAAAIVSTVRLEQRRLMAYCRSHLAAFKVPEHWFQVAELPLTASGKVRKVELRERAAAGELSALHTG